MIVVSAWLRRTLILSSIGLGALASQSAARNVGGQQGDSWAIGYAVHVARSCPTWTVEPQQKLADRRVLPLPDSPTRMLPLNGSAERGFYRGQADALADARRHARFCANIPSIAGPRWPRLARVLRSSRQTNP